MATLKKLAGDTALYGISSIVGRMLNFFLVPLYTARLSPGEYGVVTEIYSYVAFANALYTFGLETAYFRLANREGADKQQAYSQAFTGTLLTGLLFSVPLLIWAGNFAASLGLPGKGQYIQWMTLTVAIDAVTTLPFARLRLMRKAFNFAAIRLGNIVLVVALNLFFLYGCPYILQGHGPAFLQSLVSRYYNPEFGAGYIFLSNLLANATLLIFLYRSILAARIQLTLACFGPMLKYGYPIMIMGLAGAVNEMFSRAILKSVLPPHFYPQYSNADALGVFGACYKLSVFMALAIQAFRYAADPFFFSKASDKNSPQVFAEVMRWFVISCLLIFLAVSLNLELIGKLFLKRAIYRDGLGVVPVLLLANMMLGIYYNLTVWFKLTDRTHWGTIISLSAAALTVFANLLLIPVFGYAGSALATLICYAGMAAACFILGARYYPVPYSLKSFFGYTALAVGLATFSFRVSLPPLQALGFHTGLLLVFVGAVIYFEKDRLPRLPGRLGRLRQ